MSKGQKSVNDNQLFYRLLLKFLMRNRVFTSVLSADAVHGRLPSGARAEADRLRLLDPEGEPHVPRTARRGVLPDRQAGDQQPQHAPVSRAPHSA